jgi:hypothetical protein
MFILSVVYKRVFNLFKVVEVVTMRDILILLCADNERMSVVWELIIYLSGSRPQTWMEKLTSRSGKHLSGLGIILMKRKLWILEVLFTFCLNVSHLLLGYIWHCQPLINVYLLLM